MASRYMEIPDLPRLRNGPIWVSASAASVSSSVIPTSHTPPRSRHPQAVSLTSPLTAHSISIARVLTTRGSQLLHSPFTMSLASIASTYRSHSRA